MIALIATNHPRDQRGADIMDPWAQMRAPPATPQRSVQTERGAEASQKARGQVQAEEGEEDPEAGGPDQEPEDLGAEVQGPQPAGGGRQRQTPQPRPFPTFWRVSTFHRRISSWPFFFFFVLAFLGAPPRSERVRERALQIKAAEA